MRTRGGGVKNPETFADVLYGWSLDTLLHELGMLVGRHHEAGRAHRETDVLDAVMPRDVEDMSDHGRDVVVSALVPTDKKTWSLNDTLNPQDATHENCQ